jgi:hypothetical protein
MSPNPIREFILGMLRDPEAAAAYRADPARALHATGLAALAPRDIAAMAPMIAESALIPGGERLAAVLAGTDGAVSDVGTEPDDDRGTANVSAPTAETWSSAHISRAFDY